MRGRPDVDVKMPTVVHPGDDIAVVLLVESHSDTPIDFLDVAWRGVEDLWLFTQGQRHDFSREIVDTTVRVREKGTLKEGRHRHEVKLRVPRDAPPSYMGPRVTIRYEVRVHVAIPWWPDLRETYEVLVEPRPTARPKAAPATHTSPRKGGAFIELSLADTAFAAGDEIAGAFAIGNAPPRADLGVELSLVAFEAAKHDGGVARAEQFRHLAPSVFRAAKAGVEVPFRFRVPKDVSPRFESPWCELTWVVEATLGLTWGETVKSAVPVAIERFVSAHDAGGARPQIGAQKWRRTWAEAGEKHGLALADDRLALTGSRGEIRLEIARDVGGDEPMLIATLRYPSLALGLRASPQRLIVLPNELEARLHGDRVECREHEQGKAFLTTKLCAALAAFEEVRLDDTRAQVRHAGSGLDAEGLEGFLWKAAALADELTSAMADIPPPAAMSEALPEWQAFAIATGAHLAVGGMALTAASFEGAVFDVTTLFGEKAEITGTRVTLEIDPPLSYRVSMADLDTFSAAPPGSREIAVELQKSVVELDIQPHCLGVVLAGSALDPADLRPRVLEMLALGRRLRGDRSPGPYR